MQTTETSRIRSSTPNWLNRLLLASGVCASIGASVLLYQEPSSLQTQSIAVGQGREDSQSAVVPEAAALRPKAASGIAKISVPPFAQRADRRPIEPVLGDVHLLLSMVPLPDFEEPDEGLIEPVHDEVSTVHYSNSDTHTGTTSYHYQNSDTHHVSSAYHFSNSDTHTWPSNTHRPNTDIHSSTSDTHLESTDNHYSNSDTHYESSDYHNSNTDTHYTSSDRHFDNSDTHFKDSDYHANNTDTHTAPSTTHKDNTDVHGEYSSNHIYKLTETHTPPSDIHDSESNTHYTNSDTHQEGSSHHLGGSNIHISSSTHHLTDSTHTPGDPDGNDCPNPSPNQGDVRITGGGNTLHINQQTHAVWDDEVTVDFTHIIVTYDTPRARNLHGHFRLEVDSGDADVVQVLHNGQPYTPGTPIHVTEFGHSGCGVHTWHGGIEQFTIRLMKPGQVTLKASVDPLPEPEGDGEPRESAFVIVDIPEFKEEWFIRSKAYIPCPVVWAQAPFFVYYAGDGRGPGVLAGMNWGGDLGSRTAIEARVNLDPEENDILGSPKLQFGETKQYHSTSVQSSGAVPGCSLALLPSAVPIHTATQDEEIDFTFTGGSSPATAAEEGNFKAYVDGPNPLISLTSIQGEIKQSFDIGIRECLGHSWYRLSGHRSNYPAHELYLDNLTLHYFSPAFDTPIPFILFETTVPDTGWLQIN